MGTLSYIKNFIKDRDVAAITPSSSYLVKRVCRWIDFDTPCTIVEYGPGDGVFSRYIARNMHPDSSLVLIESNDGFVEDLESFQAQNTQVTVVHDRAENVESIIEGHDLDPVDYIISGIPFSFLDEPIKTELIQSTFDALHDDGKFLVYQNYNHMEQPLRDQFPRVEKEYVLFNIPPMFAYEARKR